MRQPLVSRIGCFSMCVAGALALFGCSRAAPPSDAAKAPPPAAPAPSEKSTTDLVVDGVTGRAAIQAGQKARTTIEKVKAQNESNMAEADKF